MGTIVKSKKLFLKATKVQSKCLGEEMVAFYKKGITRYLKYSRRLFTENLKKTDE